MAVALEPAAGVVDRALLQPLMKVMGWAVAIGILWMLRHFVRATVGGIAGLIGHVPGIGGVLSSPVNAVEHWMDTEFGKAEAACDAQMAEGLHALARLIERIGHDFRTHGTLLYQLAQVMTHPLSISAYRSLFAAEWKATAGIRNSIRHSTVGYIGAAIAFRLRPITGELHTLERWTWPRVKTLERDITVTIPKDVAGLRIRTKTIEGELSKLYDLIRKNEAALAATAFAGAVALALSRLGLGWLRCSSLRNLGNRLGCGGWRILDELLAGVIDVLVIADLCQLTKLLIQVAESSEVQGVLSGIIGGIDELLLCQGVARPDELHGYWTEPPPPQKFAALPAV